MCIFFNFDHLNIKLQISKLIWSTKFRALLSLSLHSSPSSSKLLSMASYGGELLLDSSSPWSGISSLSSFSISLPFIFQEAKESIDEEDPRPTSSNGAYITWDGSLRSPNSLSTREHPSRSALSSCCSTWMVLPSIGFNGHIGTALSPRGLDFFRRWNHDLL